MTDETTTPEATATTEPAPAPEAPPAVEAVAPDDAPIADVKAVEDPAKTKRRPVRRIPETRNVRVPQPDAIAAELGKEARALNCELGRVEDAKDLANKEFKKKIDALSAERDAKLAMIEDSFVDIKCERQIDYDAGTLTIRRLDTGEALETRALVDEEKNGSLEFGSVDSKASKKQLTLAAVKPLASVTSLVPEAPVSAVEPPRWGVRYVAIEGAEPALYIDTIVDGDGERVETMTWLSLLDAATGAGYLSKSHKWHSHEIVQVSGVDPAQKFVVRWRDKANGHTGTEHLSDKEIVFASRAAAEAHVALQAEYYGQYTEYTVEPHAPKAPKTANAPEPIGVEASELEGVPVVDDAARTKAKRGKGKGKGKGNGKIVRSSAPLGAHE